MPGAVGTFEAEHRRLPGSWPLMCKQVAARKDTVRKSVLDRDNPPVGKGDRVTPLVPGRREGPRREQRWPAGVGRGV